MTKKNKVTSSVGHADYISSGHAVKLLCVKLQTFYTYVSRGLVRRHEIPGQKRKLYSKSDVERLAAKSNARSNTGAKAGDSMRYGNPVVQSVICEITSEGPVYRNRLATDLAGAKIPFEAVVELLWVGRFRTPQKPWKIETLPKDFFKWTDRACELDTTKEVDPVGLMIFLLTSLRASGTREDDASSGNTQQLAHQLLQVFAGVSGYLGPKRQFEPIRSEEMLSNCIARGLGVAHDFEAIEAINSALIICAEHELAPPTFAARICASTGADIYACVATGALAHMGHLQGGGTDGAEDLLEEVLKPSGRITLPSTQWTSRFDFPGFNHPLYARDPRAVFLINLIKNLKSAHPDSVRVLDLIDDIENKMNFYPGITAALVALSLSLGLPRRSANLIFSVGRTAGWIAHILEQRMAGFVLRPRAQFVASRPAVDLGSIK